MKKVNIKARVKRNRFEEIAGDHYRDENSEIVKYLNSVDKEALLGIQREDGIYTIIGEKSVYYSTALGKEGEISHKDFLDVLKENGWRLGKGGQFEFINVNETDAVWLQNAAVMSVIWNTIILLHNNNNT